MRAVEAFVQVAQRRHRRRRRREVRPHLRVWNEAERDLAVLHDDGRRGHDLLGQVEALTPAKVFNAGNDQSILIQLRQLNLPEGHSAMDKVTTVLVSMCSIR